MPKVQEKPSALKSEHPALQKMKILSFFLVFGGIFYLLDPDPDPTAQTNADPCGSGSETLETSNLVFEKQNVVRKFCFKSFKYVACRIIVFFHWDCSEKFSWAIFTNEKTAFSRLCRFNLFKTIRIKSTAILDHQNYQNFENFVYSFIKTSLSLLQTLSALSLTGSLTNTKSFPSVSKILQSTAYLLDDVVNYV